jgi:hypothetical protein
MPQKQFLSLVRAAVLLNSDNAHAQAFGAQIDQSIMSFGPIIFPANVQGPSVSIIEQMAERHWGLEFSETDYIDLAVQEHLLNLKIRLAYALKFAPPSLRDYDEITKNINVILEGGKASMVKHIVGDPPLYSAADIEDRMQTIRDILYVSRDDPTYSSLKIPMKEEKTQAILLDFEHRLSAAHDRLLVRLQEPATRQRSPKDLQLVQDGLRNSSFDEIRAFLMNALLDNTVDPRRQVDLSKDVAPTYADIRTSLGKKVDELRKSTKAANEATNNSTGGPK